MNFETSKLGNDLIKSMEEVIESERKRRLLEKKPKTKGQKSHVKKKPANGNR